MTNTLARRQLAASIDRRAAVLAGVLLLGAVLLGAPSSALAQVTCTNSGPTFTLGTINPYSGYPYTTSGSIVMTCTNSGSTRRDVYTCLSVGFGSGGTTAIIDRLEGRGFVKRVKHPTDRRSVLVRTVEQSNHTAQRPMALQEAVYARLEALNENERRAVLHFLEGVAADVMQAVET